MRVPDIGIEGGQPVGMGLPDPPRHAEQGHGEYPPALQGAGTRHLPGYGRQRGYGTGLK